MHRPAKIAVIYVSSYYDHSRLARAKAELSADHPVFVSAPSSNVQYSTCTYLQHSRRNLKARPTNETRRLRGEKTQADGVRPSLPNSFADGHVRTLAETIAEEVKASGAEVTLLQIPEVSKPRSFRLEISPP